MVQFKKLTMIKKNIMTDRTPDEKGNEYNIMSSENES